MDENRLSRAEPFLERFVSKYGPCNTQNASFPIVREGVYKGMVFTVRETRYTYKVTVGEKTKKFGNAWLAGKWIENQFASIGHTYNYG